MFQTTNQKKPQQPQKSRSQKAKNFLSSPRLENRKTKTKK
jgi:hypothetical protein